MSKTITSTIAASALVLLVGCGADNNGNATAQQAEWLLTSAPAGAVSLTDAKASAKEGDEVVIRARIGGRKQPITPESAAFVVMDLAIPHCGENADDKCPTPWDYCCETPATIAANSATVIVVGEDGSSQNPASVGLAALDEIVIIGTVGPRPTPEVFTVRATGIYAEPN